MITILSRAFLPSVVEQIQRHLDHLAKATKLLGDLELQHDRFGRPSGIVITIKVPRVRGGK